MASIKRLTYLDIPKIKKLVSYDGEKLSSSLFGLGFMVLQRFFPLRWRVLPETFIMVEGKEILGLITAATTLGNPYKINITRLIFRDNEAGKQLVEYIIPKYGAKGAVSFTVSVDNSHGELLDLFVSGCGFRQCSTEELWKGVGIGENNTTMQYRVFNNCDSQQVCELYNNELISHFRPSLERTKWEFCDPICAGLVNFYKRRYVLEQNNTIISHVSITTTDNRNYVLDISKVHGYELAYDEIINFAVGEISRRQSEFFPVIKLRKYIRDAENFENYLKHRGASLIETRHILVKDFYRPIKQTNNPLRIFSLGEQGALSS